MQNTNNSAFPLMISIVVMNESQLRSVYALLGGAAIAVAQNVPETVSVPPATAPAIVETPVSEPQAPESPVSVAEVPASTAIVSDEVDAHGHPWSPDLHASTQSKTKDGLWRMKVGVERPAPKPGFPIASGADTGTTQETSTPSAISQPVVEPASAPSTIEEDEFAAFRNAAAASDAADAAAKASVPVRTYSDADLGALCNQAAVKLGDPSPIKEIITQYVPEGVVAHSRNIPEDKRAEFVAAVEAKAGIEFAG